MQVPNRPEAVLKPLTPLQEELLTSALEEPNASHWSQVLLIFTLRRFLQKEVWQLSF